MVTSTSTRDVVHSPQRDAVIQLRVWGSEIAYPLPAQLRRGTLGGDPACTVCLSGPGVLPWHAQLARERRHWLVRALGGTGGLSRDGARCDAFALEPGVELGVAGHTLVAENATWIDLRRFCARLLGWAPERLPVIDRALRALRASTTHRAPLVLCGGEDLVPIARALHRRTLGPDRPFFVCDPRRRAGPASVRAAASCVTGLAGLQSAAGGSLCVRLRRPPPDMEAVQTQLAAPGADVQLLLCGAKPELGEPAMRVTPIEIPALTDRSADLPRLVDEYARDACATLAVPPEAFTADDHAWVLSHATASHAALEKATLRRLVLRTSANLSRSAAQLGMAPVSLARWNARTELRTAGTSRA